MRTIPGHIPVAVLSNGVAGAEKQAVALARCLGLPFKVHRIELPKAYGILPTQFQVPDMLDHACVVIY